MRDINFIVVHQSASPLNTTAKDIDDWHKAKGWSGIGYHMVIEGLGKMVRGRELSKVGAHVKGMNSDSVGICVVGNNLKCSQKWRSVQIESLVKVVDVFKALFPDAVVLGHRDMPNTATECPGLDVRHLLRR